MEKSSFLRWQGSEDVSRFDVLEHFVGDDGEEWVGVDEEYIPSFCSKSVLCSGQQAGRLTTLTISAVLLKVSSQVPISLSIPSL